MNKNIRIIHPGEVLREDFLIPNKITNEQLAKSLHVQPEIIDLFCEEKLDLSIDLAHRLASYLDMSVEFWIGLQKAYEIDLYKLWNRNLNLSQTILPYKQNSSRINL